MQATCLYSYLLKRHQYACRFLFLLLYEGLGRLGLQCTCEREGIVVGNMSTSIVCAGICVFMSTCTQTCEWFTKHVVNHVTLWPII